MIERRAFTPTSAAAWLDQFLRQSGVRSDERVTVISDDAGEFEKAVAGRRLARGRILDRFYVAMMFEAAQQSVRGSKSDDPTQRDAVKRALQCAKWLVWHGKGGRTVTRIKALEAALMVSERHEDSTLWWNLRRLYFHLANKYGTLVNYSARHRKGLPTSSGIAESAVNQVVSHRIAKKQQMRWTNDGAPLPGSGEIAGFNGELSVQRLVALACATAANSPNERRSA